MNIRFLRPLMWPLTALSLAGSLLAAASPARADLSAAAIRMDLKPNLKISSTLGWQYDPVTKTAVQVLLFRVANEGLMSAPATKTALSIEAGYPFSPIGTAIALQLFDTPALIPGAGWTHAISLGSGEAVYLKLDLYADYGNHVVELSENDNHRVHVIGYAP